MCVAVVEHLVNSPELQFVVTPDLLAKGFLCDNRIRYARAGNILAYIVILAVLGILGLIES